MMQINIPEQDLANLVNFMQRPDLKPAEYPSWARIMQHLQAARRIPAPDSVEAIIPPSPVSRPEPPSANALPPEPDGTP